MLQEYRYSVRGYLLIDNGIWVCFSITGTYRPTETRKTQIALRISQRNNTEDNFRESNLEDKKSFYMKAKMTETQNKKWRRAKEILEADGFYLIGRQWHKGTKLVWWQRSWWSEVTTKYPFLVKTMERWIMIQVRGNGIRVHYKCLRKFLPVTWKFSSYVCICLSHVRFHSV